MAQLLVGIQYVSIIALFIECWVVFVNWKEKLHSYLFFSCIATLVNNMGYLMELKSHSEEAYFNALQLSYLGRNWISFALFLFIAELVHHNFSYYLKVVLANIHVLIYILVITTKETGLYYSSMQFQTDGIFPRMQFKAGLGHHVLTGMIVIYLMFGIAMLVMTRYKEENAIIRKRLLMVLFAVITEGAFSIIQMLKLVNLTRVFDITMLGYPIGTFFMFIAIFKYKLLDTETLAREYVIDELSEGIIAVDGQGMLSFVNKPALSLFPDIHTDLEGVINQLQHLIEEGEPLLHGDRIYTPEKNMLYQNEMVLGIIYALIDDTEHYHYLDELKEKKRIADSANKAKSAFRGKECLR